MPPADIITPRMILQAYAQGYFPMADSRHGRVDWYTADPRATIPLDAFHIPRGLARRLRKNDFVITVDRAFNRVIRACAQPRIYAQQTWINSAIIDVFIKLHDQGHAHSVEAWRATTADGSPISTLSSAEPGELVGGLYGVAMGGAFFGESMFSRASDASKVCLVHLVQHIRDRGYVLLDTQFANEHMMQFGLVEIPLDDYLKQLDAALKLDVTWSDAQNR